MRKRTRWKVRGEVVVGVRVGWQAAGLVAGKNTSRVG